MGRVIGIGTDLLRIGRFHELIVRHGISSAYVTRLATRILHGTRELPHFQKFQAGQNVAECTRLLSGSWAAKEAVYKTLDSEDQKGFSFKKWYKYSNVQGKPFIQGTEYAKPNEEFLLSMSHDSDFLIATVLRQEA
ncbi:hypothetical protein BABINDRAFT_159173 [Babjeviella inositovora NRRL Y-12698]|uniref:4'-phosphopantetheinyl transferase domain-containing protein n=1 Tax=Babjeviella inositovora NRRL Y-12698 TaxID=984486 RepID=A0A1E3QYC7_9ASCO|nr:uncharacterized protein BABINDRAFT_159173 [Babjeviella inositovora NRRL Y-12698]ODQ82621.1 hypothetical protein BABINDRAFT_159173 [Babjeviella inositovora NRRL Y-12698]